MQGYILPKDRGVVRDQVATLDSADYGAAGVDARNSSRSEYGQVHRGQNNLSDWFTDSERKTYHQKSY